MTHDQIKNIHKPANLKVQKLAFYVKTIKTCKFLFLIKVIIRGRICQLQYNLYFSTNFSHICK